MRRQWFEQTAALVVQLRIGDVPMTRAQVYQYLKDTILPVQGNRHHETMMPWRDALVLADKMMKDVRSEMRRLAREAGE